MEARGLEVEDRAGMLVVDEVVRDRLVDRDGDRAGRISLVATVDRDRLVVH